MTANDLHSLSDLFLCMAVLCLLCISYDVRWRRCWRLAYYATAMADVALMALHASHLIA